MSLRSGIYWGNVRHRRFATLFHQFSYQIYMMGLDLDELEQASTQSRLFGQRWFNPIRFKESDYIKGDDGTLKQRIASKVRSLGGNWDTDGRSMMLAQCRCLGLYFSPINFYFCYDSDDNCQYMLAEVSNTPWRERHYYLLNFSEELKVKKAFHVSPFMGMDMDYHWKISPPDKRVRVHIENHQQEKVFDATMALIRQPLETKQLLSTLLSIPSMTLKIVLSIYWQALKLFIGKVPFVAHPNTSQKS